MTLLPIAIYATILLLITWRTSRHNSNDQDFFLAGRNIPVWLAFVSVVATETSVATIVVFPQIGIQSGFVLLVLCLGYIIGRFLVAYFYLGPIYSNHKLSIYSTITKGDKSATQVLSAFYLLAKFISSGVRFFIGGVALYQLFSVLNPIFQFPEIKQAGVILWILILAFFAGLYSLSGGLRAVVITDQLQGYIILLTGLALCLVLYMEIQSTGTEVHLQSQHFYHLNFSWSDPLFMPVLFVGAIIFSIGSHGADQDMLQRVLATGTLSQARKSLILSGIGATVVIMLFLTFGFLLKFSHPDLTDYETPLIAYIQKFNAPLLNGGFAVLLLAAAMSTIDSAMHSTGAVWKQILGGNYSGRRYSFLSLIILTGFAIAFTFSSNSNFFSLAMGSMNYVNGGLIAVLSLYIFKKRAVSLPGILAAMLSCFTITLLCNTIAIGVDPATGQKSYLGWTYIALLSTGSALLAGLLVEKIHTIQSSQSVS